MPKFIVEALEKFTMRTTYVVEAADAKEAERLCRSGEWEYNDLTVEEGDEEWLRTVSVEEDSDGQ